MAFDFTIPHEMKDLLKRTSENQFVVEEVLPVRLLAGKLQETKSMLRMRGPIAIEQQFDALYSVLKHFDEVDTQMKEDLYDILVRAVSVLADQLVDVLDGDMEPEVRRQRLNLVKMSTYLLCKSMDMFENGKPALIITAGKGRKKQRRRSDDGLDWDSARVRGVRALAMLIQLRLHRLWDPPVPEDEFVSMITSSCYKMLESPSSVKDKETRDVIFHLIGLMVKKYGHGLSCTIKIIQLLQVFEHLAHPFAGALQMWATELGIRSIIGDVLRDVGRLDPRDLARDTSGTRAFASFLVELAERVPALILPSMCVLTPLLDGESYTMRSSVLSVLGEMIVKVLSGDNMDEKMKKQRDSFLDVLEEHIHDVNAFSRSRCLHVWMDIVNERKLPLHRQQSMVELVVGRLEDKSSQVRKQAMQLLTCLLQSNPFAAKLPIEELQVNYETEHAKLQEMMPEQPETPVRGLHAEQEEQWTRMEKDVMAAISHAMEAAEGEDMEVDESLIAEDATHEAVREQMVSLLKERKYQSALELLRAAREAFPGEVCFTARPPSINKSLEAAADDSQEEEGETEDDAAKAAEQQVRDQLRTLKSIFLGEGTMLAVLTAATEPGTQHGSPPGVVNEVSKQQVLVQYLQDSLAFAKQIQKAVPIICQLLGSKSTMDVLEAIEFFVTGMEFGVGSAVLGVRRMLVLVWSKEASVKDAVVNAYRRLYLKPKATSPKARALEIVSDLTTLTYNATLGDLMSLEELVSELVKSGELDNQIIRTLWERFSRKTTGTTDAESRGALLLISMAAGADVEIVRSNVDVLVQEGLGPRAEDDPELTKETCVALQKLTGPAKQSGTSGSAPFRLPADHDMFIRLKHLVIIGVSNKDTHMWVPMAEQAVNVIYKLAETPDCICEEILKQLAATVLRAKDAAVEVTKDAAAEETQDAGAEGTQDATAEGTQETTAEVTKPKEGARLESSMMLARLLSVVGHVALRQLIHVDVAVLNELKRRSALNEDSASKKPSATPSTSRRKESNKEKGEDLTAEEEMGLAGASADDTEAEYMRAITEDGLVTGTNLLAVFHSLILEVVNNPTKYDDADLQTAATLALSKYMTVSTKFCEQHLQLLFTILEKSPHAVIRANTIVALGDLTFRFPNSVEPWTPNLYGRLRDTTPRVRKNTLMVLTHLILNDMIKVKGQISELASCIVDHDEQIQARAKLFFHELAKKGNAVYNIMPDIISRLSDPDVGVPEDNFRTIMKYLFSFIQKDRQCESLVEKLCHRFRAARNNRQWRDLAFCLSMLTYNDRSIRKLQENFACFADKLAEQDVYNSFVTIMDSAKKFAKPESRALLEEFEQRLLELHEKGLGEDEVAQKASEAVAAVRAKGKRTPGRRNSRGQRQKKRTPTKNKKKRGSRDDDDDDDEENASADGSDAEFVQPTQRAPRKVAAKKAKPMSFSSDEDSDIDLFEVEDREADTSLTESKDTENSDPKVLLEKHLSPRLPRHKPRHKPVRL